MICLRETCKKRGVLLLEQQQVCAASLARVCSEEAAKGVDPAFRAQPAYTAMIAALTRDKSLAGVKSVLLSLELRGGGRHFVLIREGKQHVHASSDDTVSMDVANWLAIDCAKVCLKRSVPIHAINNVLLRCKTPGLSQADLDMLTIMFAIDSILLKKCHQIVRKLQNNTKAKLHKFANGVYK